jgi:hypothetical protein
VTHSASDVHIEWVGYSQVEWVNRGSGVKGTKPTRKGKALDEGGSRVKGKAPAKNKLDTTPCDTCGERFCDDNTGRRWIQCQMLTCLKWFHHECRGLSEERIENFTCISCESNDSD